VNHHPISPEAKLAFTSGFPDLLFFRAPAFLVHASESISPAKEPTLPPQGSRAGIRNTILSRTRRRRQQQRRGARYSQRWHERGHIHPYTHTVRIADHWQLRRLGLLLDTPTKEAFVNVHDIHVPGSWDLQQAVAWLLAFLCYLLLLLLLSQHPTGQSAPLPSKFKAIGHAFVSHITGRALKVQSMAGVAKQIVVSAMSEVWATLQIVSDTAVQSFTHSHAHVLTSPFTLMSMRGMERVSLTDPQS
jgi:hypothetical protein